MIVMAVIIAFWVVYDTIRCHRARKRHAAELGKRDQRIAWLERQLQPGPGRQPMLEGRLHRTKPLPLAAAEMADLMGRLAAMECDAATVATTIGDGLRRAGATPASVRRIAAAMAWRSAGGAPGVDHGRHLALEAPLTPLIPEAGDTPLARRPASPMEIAAAAAGAPPRPPPTRLPGPGRLRRT